MNAIFTPPTDPRTGSPATRDVLDGAARLMLATVIIVMCSVAMWMLLKHEMPLTNRDAVMLGFGVLLSLLKDAFGYYFNATASGARKDSVIAATALSASTPAATPPQGTQP